MDLIPKPDQVVSAASNVAHAVLYGGLADLRKMPRTLIDDGTLRELYHYRPVGKVKEDGDPVLLVMPLAAPSSCFDLRRGCSLVEHLVAEGRPTYLVEYGEVSFKDRNLGMEHWIDEVIPAAIRETSAHAGGRPVHVVGWSLGGLFARAHRRRPARPADRVAVAARLPLRRLQGADDRAAAAAVRARGPAAARVQEGQRPDHPDLPGGRRRPEAAGALGVPAVLGAEAGHQAAGEAAAARRHRLPRPARGGRRVRRADVRLPRPDVRAALPPVHQEQRPARGVLRARRPPDRAVRDPGAGADLRRAPPTASRRSRACAPAYPC